jgi:hypothetical protein
MAYKIKQEKKLKWKSVYEAPTEKIRKIFKQSYGRYPTNDELNDIILEGEF